MGWLFIAGCVANQSVLYHRFDAVVLLSAPVDVLLERVTDRANPFGSSAEDRAKIASDLATSEPLLRRRRRSRDRDHRAHRQSRLSARTNCERRSSSEPIALAKTPFVRQRSGADAPATSEG
jgi:hypothetical protein